MSYDLVVHNRQGTHISIPPFVQWDEKIIVTTHDGNGHTCTCECFGVWVNFFFSFGPTLFINTCTHHEQLMVFYKLFKKNSKF